VARNTELATRKPPTRPAPRRTKSDRRVPPVLPEFDAIIHERMRLGIVSALAVNDSMSFTDLKRLLKTTDGNLSVHARKLEEAGYVACSKFFEGRMPKTEYRLTSPGRQAFDRYLRDMESMIRATRDR
jgi:DNA-binding HxlR family transcriptional regulator